MNKGRGRKKNDFKFFIVYLFTKTSSIPENIRWKLLLKRKGKKEPEEQGRS